MSVFAGRGGFLGATMLISALALTSCGLPGDGSVRAVDDDTVPYHLLDSATPSASTSSAVNQPVRRPVVFWVAGDRVVPEPTDASCDETPDEVIERLLSMLASGPSEDERSAGLSSALPPDSGLDLVRVADGTAEVDIEPGTSLSAERLPVAVGQVVLTVTSAPSVESVLLVADGQPVQVPLPDGALTDGPVAAADYIALAPDRFKSPGAFGCPDD